MRAPKARLYATRPNLNDRAGTLGSYLLHILLYRQFGHWGTLLEMMYNLEILYWVMEYWILYYRQCAVIRKMLL